MNEPEVQLPGMHLEEAPSWAIDVVCGMEIDPSTTSNHFNYMGRLYSFCGPNCMEHFKNIPEQYAS